MSQSANQFLRREDESSDRAFYRSPRFVTHIDDGAIVDAYVRAAGGFEEPVTSRRTPDPETGYRGDPLFAVVAIDEMGPPRLAPMAAAGIPLDAVAFYAELEANNTKDWWAANKERYERSVREPFAALTDALADEFGEARIFRPYRDVRFSADKTLYKTEQGAIVSASGGAGYYLRVGSDGLVTGGGYMHGMPDQVARYRAALDADTSGPALVTIVDGLRRKGFEIGGETLATRPKGVAADHPRLELLRHKSLIAWRDRGTPTWMSTGSVVRYVRDDWRAIRPMVEWIGEHVGESTMPMPPRGRR